MSVEYGFYFEKNEGCFDLIQIVICLVIVKIFKK
jgi:hypothetical protein